MQLCLGDLLQWLLVVNSELRITNIPSLTVLITITLYKRRISKSAQELSLFLINQFRNSWDIHVFIIYLVNKPLLVAAVSKDNAQGWKIVRKMNSWPRSEASRITVKFWGQLFSRFNLRYTSKSERGLFIYSPRYNFSRRTHVDHSCIFCRFLRIALCDF